MRIQSNFDFYNYIAIFPYFHFFVEIILQKHIFITILEDYSRCSTAFLHIFYIEHMS